MRHRWLLLLMVLIFGSCRPVDDEASVTLSEFRIETTFTRLAITETSIQVVNQGQFPHTLVVNEAEGAVLGATSLLLPGETATLALEPTAGRLMFTCRIVTEIDGGEIIDHYQRGMVAVVTAAP